MALRAYPRHRRGRLVRRRDPGRANGIGGPRDPADRQQRDARNRRDQGRCRGQGCRRGALRGVADRPARGLQGAVGQDQWAADFRSADLERFGARRPGRVDRRAERADRPQPLYRRAWRAVRPDARGGAARGGRAAAALGADAAHPADDDRGIGDLGRAEECVAARVGAISHLAKRDRLCPGERDGGRSPARQRGAGAAPGARVVAQHRRLLRRVERARGRGQPQAALSRRAGARVLHRALRARRRPARQLRPDRAQQRRHPADDGRGRRADGRIVHAGARRGNIRRRQLARHPAAPAAGRGRGRGESTTRRSIARWR